MSVINRLRSSVYGFDSTCHVHCHYCADNNGPTTFACLSHDKHAVAKLSQSAEFDGANFQMEVGLPLFWRNHNFLKILCRISK